MRHQNLPEMPSVLVLRLAKANLSLGRMTNVIQLGLDSTYALPACLKMDQYALEFSPCCLRV